MPRLYREIQKCNSRTTRESANLCGLVRDCLMARKYTLRGGSAARHTEPGHNRHKMKCPWLRYSLEPTCCHIRGNIVTQRNAVPLIKNPVDSQVDAASTVFPFGRVLHDFAGWSSSPRAIQRVVEKITKKSYSNRLFLDFAPPPMREHPPWILPVLQQAAPTSRR